jgi:hypothetical protein
MTKTNQTDYAIKKEVRRAQEQHANEKNEWAFYIGHTVLTFSEIEHLTLLFIERVAPTLRDFGVSLLLDKRLDLLLHILQEFEHIDQELMSRLTASLKLAQKLASKRNLIVHNPVLLTFTTDSSTGRLTGEGRIASARNTNIDMNLQKMGKFVQEADACRAEINYLFSRLAVRISMAKNGKPKIKRAAPNKE